MEERSNTVNPLRILLLEDDPLDAELIEATLHSGGLKCTVRRVAGRQDFIAALDDAPDVILSDYSLPGFDGFSALRLAVARNPEVPFLFVSGAIGEDRALETLRAGATDYVLKDRLERLVPAVRRAVREVAERAARRQLEEELRQRALELARANRRKDEFLAMLAHELRNPLEPIRNAVALLRLCGLIQPEAIEAREVLERQVGHLSRLVNDLLEIFRINQGKLQLRRDSLDLSGLVRQTVADYRCALEAAGLSVTLMVPDQAVWTTGDRTRLAQVLGNLLQNAGKFSPRGGRVEIRLEADQSQEQARLTVSDTGIGIAPELLPHVFETFAQGDSSLDRTRGGLGLGLALVKRLVELHGGEATAHSDGIGRGARFTVSLPLEAEPASTEADQPEPLPAGKGLKVLIIEDQRDAARTLRVLLAKFGHQVEMRHSGPAGVQAARDWRPDAIICDLGLPEMDGYAVARELRSDPATASARLIALSGYGQEEDRRRSFEAGFDHHLTKPADPAELHRLLVQNTSGDGVCGPAPGCYNRNGGKKEAAEVV
jgi:signal transduction histidine kinase